MSLKEALRVWWQGFVDGWRQPHNLTSGMFYGEGPDDPRNEIYDRGVNWGQFVRSPMNHQRDCH